MYDQFRSDTPMPWQGDCLPNTAKSSVGALTKEAFEDSIDEWSDLISDLPAYDEAVIRQALGAISTDIPNGGGSYADLAKAHFALARRKHEIVRLKHLVKPHYEFLHAALESLSEAALAVAPGKNKEEREGNAAAMVRRFSMYRTRAKNLLDYVVDVEKELEFAGWRMQNSSKDLENALRRGDAGMTNDGAAFTMEESSKRAEAKAAAELAAEQPQTAFSW